MEKRGLIINSLTILLLAYSCYLSIMVIKKHATLVCKHVNIHIKEQSGQSFITEQSLLDILHYQHNIQLKGTLLQEINTYYIHSKLQSHPIIKNVLVFKTWPDTLHIYVETKFVIARLLNPMEANGNPLYVDENGNMVVLQGLPLIRVLLISGELKNIAEKNSNLKINPALLELLHYLYRDPFFRLQITSLEVDSNHKITLGTQIGNHIIEFGKAEHIPKKLEKTRLFYSQIIPYKGWGAYHRINVEFEDQIICK